MFAEALIDDVLFGVMVYGDGEIFYEDVQRVLDALGLDPILFYEKVSHTLEEVVYARQAVAAFGDDHRKACWKYANSSKCTDDFVEAQVAHFGSAASDGYNLLLGLGKVFGA